MIERLVVLAVLLRPARIEQRLAALAASGTAVPNAWQVALGVLRMWHRVLFRSETVGTCGTRPVRRALRARLFAWRALRLPLLLVTRAIAPLDHSGLLSSRERVIRHLLLAHHDGVQRVYDLELLALDPGALDELVARAGAVVSGRTPFARFAQDLCVYDGYHAQLLAAAERARAGDLGVTPRELADPDLTLSGFLGWCGRQPPTLAATVAARRTAEAS